MGVIQEGFNQLLTTAAVGMGYVKHGLEENKRTTEGLKNEKATLEKTKGDLSFEKREEYKKINEASEDVALLKYNFDEETKNMASIKREKPRTDWGKEDKNRRLEASKKALNEYTQSIGAKRSQMDTFYDRIRILQQNIIGTEKEIAGVDSKLKFQNDKFKYGLFAKGGKK